MHDLQSLLSRDNQLKLTHLFEHKAHSFLITARTNAELDLALDFLKNHCSEANELALITEPDETNKIKIEATRAIIEKSFSSINKNRWFFITQAETMTNEAQNALLKLLEEPNQGIFLVLLSTQPSRLLATVRSRTQFIKLSSISKTTLTTYLKTNYPKLDATRLNQLMFIAQDNLTLLFDLINDQQLSDSYVAIATDARSLITASEAEALTIISRYFNSRNDAITLATMLLKIHQSIATTKLTTSHFAKTSKWLKTLDQLNKNCSVRLSLIEAII